MSSKPNSPTPRGTRLACALACATLLLPATAIAQAMMRPTSRPVVSAENERWYRDGQAITFTGGLYFPAGPAVYFDENEMVRTGDFRGIPLYVVPTHDIFGVIYVPAGGGLMRPYERRREGEAMETARPDHELAAGRPPVLDAAFISGFDCASVPDDYPTGPAASATPGRVRDAARPAGPLTTALKPTGVNAFYIEYDGKRWYSAGPVVDLDPAAFSRAGEYHGFPVYTAREHAEMIFVAVATDTPGLLAQYSTRR